MSQDALPAEDKQVEQVSKPEAVKAEATAKSAEAALAKPVAGEPKPAEVATTKPEVAAPKPEAVAQKPAAVAPKKVEAVAPKPKPVVQKPKVSLDDTISSMKSLQDDVGQISELRSEENRVVDVFFESFLALMTPLAKTMPVSVDALPVELGNAEQAYVDPKGNLMLLFPGGHVEIRNLNEASQRELMICVMQDVMPKFKQLTSKRRRDIESRMKFLSSVTAEIQKISKAFAAAEME
jgi:hypothetical protein